jgi:hypothetical protein
MYTLSWPSKRPNSLHSKTPTRKENVSGSYLNRRKKKKKKKKPQPWRRVSFSNSFQDLKGSIYTYRDHSLLQLSEIDYISNSHPAQTCSKHSCLLFFLHPSSCGAFDHVKQEQNRFEHSIHNTLTWNERDRSHNDNDKKKTPSRNL